MGKVIDEFMKAYIYVGAKIIGAIPMTKDGCMGYQVTFPGCKIVWVLKSTFEILHREVSVEEKEIMNATR